MEITLTPALEHAGRVVERHRMQHYASQVEAAGAGGTSAMSWRKVEKGAEDVSDRTLVAVDKAFGWPIGTTKALREGEVTEPPSELPGLQPRGNPQLAAERSPAGYDAKISKLPEELRRAIDAIIDTHEQHHHG